MQRVLIISYFFPPCTLAASNRAFGWAKYLNSFGYYPVIITRNWDLPIVSAEDVLKSSGSEIIHQINSDYEVYYLPFKAGLRDRIYIEGNRSSRLLCKFLTFFLLFLQNFTNHVIAHRNLYCFTKNFLKENPDITKMIVTANPFNLFRFGYLLHKKTKIQWIADYRDDWNTSEISKAHNFPAKIIAFFERISEHKWIQTASCITSISDEYVHKISQFNHKKGHTIINGYFEEDFTSFQTAELFEKFTIIFNGTLYPTQPIEIFLEGFKRFIRKNNQPENIMLRFHGLTFLPDQASRVRKTMTGFEDYYLITDRIPRNEILAIQARSHLLLMVAHQEVQGISSSKLYEYIALKKPVIVCPSDHGIIEKTLKETGNGFIADTEGMCAQLLNQYYQNYLNPSKLFSSVNTDAIKQYSRKYSTQNLSIILDSLN